MKAKVCAAIDAWAAKVEALAQDIEREPELGFKETKTAAKVTAFLQQLGLTPQTGLGPDGCQSPRCKRTSRTYCGSVGRTGCDRVSGQL